jgi:hypothetical protein
MDFRCGIRMSLSEVRKPHIKKSVVTMAMALLLVVPGADVDAGAVPALPTLVIAIVCLFPLSSCQLGCTPF